MTALDRLPELPDLDPYVQPLLDELIRLRRSIHAHPEIGREEHHTTELILERLRAAGLSPEPLRGTGLTCDIEPIGWEHTLALRADIDALPLKDETRSTFVSTIPGMSHACGHDMHTAILVGTGLALHDLAQASELRSRIRLIFQPAEELTPGGALDIVAAGRLATVDRILALHCDPHLDVGSVGTRVGSITSASDRVTITVHGLGGHTSRPHLTQDVVYVLGELATRLPGVLARRLDPRSAVSLVWGQIHAGQTPNAIPSTGMIDGTLRCLDLESWEGAGVLVREAAESIAAAYGTKVEVNVDHGVPPTVNDPTCVALQEAAATAALGPLAVVLTEQSMGGEDFAWYLKSVPGALARLGTRRPGGRTFDLHRGDFDPDERAIEAGVRFMVNCALMNHRM